MAGWRRAVELAMGDEDVAALEAICRSRSEPASGARIPLAYRKEPSFFLAYGPMAALDYLPRPGREPTITAEAKAWNADLA